MLSNANGPNQPASADGSQSTPVILNFLQTTSKFISFKIIDFQVSWSGKSAKQNARVS
jgi:hypothetical protein